MQLPDLTLILYSALVVAALATALTHSRPLRFVRGWMQRCGAKTLACCPWCLGFWLSAAVTISGWDTVDTIYVPLVWLSTWALASVVMAPIVGMIWLLDHESREITRNLRRHVLMGGYVHGVAGEEIYPGDCITFDAETGKVMRL